MEASGPAVHNQTSSEFAPCCGLAVLVIGDARGCQMEIANGPHIRHRNRSEVAWLEWMRDVDTFR